jgi:hypothetical protein
MSQNLSTHRFRFLVAGEIIFNQADSDVTHSVRLNAMIAHTDVNLPARLIGKAQQTLQMLLFKRMGESAEAADIAMPKITVHDVVILNISNLGWMSEEEFNAPPEGTVKQEKDKNPLSLVPANDEFHIITGAAE